MITVKLKGGLGNQMFQYAIGRNLALKNNTELVLDITELECSNLRMYELGKFRISGRVVSESKHRKIHKIIRGISNIRVNRRFINLIEKNRFFDSTIMEKKGNICLEGYWQCEDYFKDIRSIIINDFTISAEPDKENKSMLEKILKSNSVSIHVRRGDYVSNKITNEHHGTCSLEYYKNAIGIIEKNVETPVFFIFSDDLNWTRENLKIEHPTIYVDINGPEKGYEDLRLMMNCKHFIVANSSFSWWGAWLSNNPSKVICAPKRWLRSDHVGDIIPKSWIKLEG